MDIPNLRASARASRTNIALFSAFRLSLSLALLIISLASCPSANARFITKDISTEGNFIQSLIIELSFEPLASINGISSLNIKAKFLRALVESNKALSEPTFEAEAIKLAFVMK